MRPFTLESPRNEAQAIAAGAAGGRFIAGGTTLIDLMREEVELLDHLVDINQLPLGDIVVEGETLVLGALASAVADLSSGTVRLTGAEVIVRDSDGRSTLAVATSVRKPRSKSACVVV